MPARKLVKQSRNRIESTSDESSGSESDRSVETVTVSSNTTGVHTNAAANQGVDVLAALAQITTHINSGFEKLTAENAKNAAEILALKEAKPVQPELIPLGSKKAAIQRPAVQTKPPAKPRAVPAKAAPSVANKTLPASAPQAKVAASEAPVIQPATKEATKSAVAKKRASSYDLFGSDDSELEQRMASLLDELPQTPPHKVARNNNQPVAVVEPKALEADKPTIAARAGYMAGKAASGPGHRITTRPQPIPSGVSKSSATKAAQKDPVAAAQEWVDRYEYNRSSQTKLFLVTPCHVSGKFFAVQGELKHDGRDNSPSINLIIGSRSASGSGEIHRSAKFPIPVMGLFKTLLSGSLNKAMDALQPLGPMVPEAKIRFPVFSEEPYMPMPM